MEFKYTALDENKKRTEGIIKCASRTHARTKVGAMNYTPLTIKKITKNDSDGMDGPDADITPILGKYLFKDAEGAIQIQITQDKPKRKDILRFTAQLITLVESGVPLLESLEILSKQQKSITFRTEVKWLYTLLQKGSSFSDALARFPDRFDTLYVAIIKSGESSGNLDKALKYILSYLEKNEKLLAQIKSAVTYPTLVVIVAVGIIWGMLTFVVPAMAENFTGSGKELPELTQHVLTVSEVVGKFWLETIIAIGVAIVAFSYWKKTPNGRYIFDHFLIKMPGIGALIQKITVSRFCNVMSSMLSSGVPLIDVMSTCILCCDNKYMETVISSAKTSVQQGSKLFEALAHNSLMPDMVISMISVGERSGQLDIMLSKVSVYYDEEVEHATSQLLSLIEPILIVGVGGFIALILVAMYLPMFDMAGNV